jgi:hypothetical protein
MTSILRRSARPLAALALLAGGAALTLGFSAGRGAAASPAPPDTAHFELFANPTFANCLAQFPGDPSRAPRAAVTVQRGDLNDTLTIHISNIKPHLNFDLFTVQRSAFLADGKPDLASANRGLAWYQSDLQSGADGTGQVRVRTVLLDQIFGFDPDAHLAPTNTFHVGFWFNDPADAQQCGFDPANFTPFNGQHHAGPLAMISLPDATTGLGPLCLRPDTSVTPARCNP